MADAKTITTSNGTVVKIKDQDMRNMTGDAFSTSSTYAVGDFCIYNNKLYRCTTAISTAGAWDSSKWTETQIGDEISQLNSNLIKYKEYTVTLSTSAWQGVYYGDASLSSVLNQGYTAIGAVVIDINSNRPSYAYIYANGQTVRVATPATDIGGTDAKVRVIFTKTTAL